MDFAIEMTAGDPEMTWTKAGNNNLLNNIALSLQVKRGAFFALPGFGSRLHLLKKNTPSTAALAEEYCREALAWIIAAGRAKSIGITAERDALRWPDRLLLAIEVVAADDRITNYEQFVNVV